MVRRTAKRVQVVSALVEGVGVNATVRMTGISKPTILKLLARLGEACDQYQDEHVRNVRNVRSKRIQCDEIWAFCHCKQKNIPQGMEDQLGYGDVWTWTALDADTKLMVTWLVGNRTAVDAQGFINDVRDRLANKVQLRTDGLKVYLEAVDEAFGGEVDYAQLVKLYGEERAGEARYSPAVCTGCRKDVVSGEPDAKHISTSYVERSNLTIRMQVRRFTRLTNGFSKKIQNHEHHVALFFMYYNFCRIHSTLRVTPAMAAGLTTRLWEIEDIVGLID